MIKKIIPTKLVWTSFDNRQVLMSEIEDDHLHNIVHHIHQLYSYYNKEIYEKIMIYAIKRGVNITAAKSHQKPFLNQKGEFVIWDYNKGMYGAPNP